MVVGVITLSIVNIMLIEVVMWCSTERSDAELHRCISVVLKVGSEEPQGPVTNNQGICKLLLL